MICMKWHSGGRGGFGCEIKGEGLFPMFSIGVICSFQDRPQYATAFSNKENNATPNGMLKDGII